MLLLITGRNTSFVVSRGGERPLRVFLKRHSLKGEIRPITPTLSLAELRKVNWSAGAALRGLARTTFRELFLHGLTSGRPVNQVERAPDQVNRRDQLQSQYLELAGRTRHD